MATQLELKTVPIRLIVPNPLQPRQSFNENDLADLTASIAEHGILQPPTVRTGAITPEGERGYYLIAGERRTRAAELAGFYEIPVLVKEVTQLQGGVLAAIENLQRSDLTPFEESDMILSLQIAAEEAGQKLTIQELAKKLGKGRGVGYIENRLAINGMGPDVQEMIRDREDSLVHAKYIDGIAKTEFRTKLIELTLDGVSLLALRQLIRYLQEAKSHAGIEQLEELADFYQQKRSFIAKNPDLLESRVTQYISRIDALKESSSAPDTQTQSRINTNSRTGGGNVSRGLEVTGTSARDAKAEFKAALEESQRHLHNALAWRDQIGDLSKENQQRLADIEQLFRRLKDS
jgi:ParB/RepB/Spo0J family partition protein